VVLLVLQILGLGFISATGAQSSRVAAGTEDAVAADWVIGVFWRR